MGCFDGWRVAEWGMRCGRNRDGAKMGNSGIRGRVAISILGHPGELFFATILRAVVICVFLSFKSIKKLMATITNGVII